MPHSLMYVANIFVNPSKPLNTPHIMVASTNDDEYHVSHTMAWVYMGKDYSMMSISSCVLCCSVTCPFGISGNCMASLCPPPFTEFSVSLACEPKLSGSNVRKHSHKSSKDKPDLAHSTYQNVPSNRPCLMTFDRHDAGFAIRSMSARMSSSSCNICRKRSSCVE